MTTALQALITRGTNVGYSSDDIQVLPGLEAVRRRPTMYVGELDGPLLANRLLQESLCIAIDDAANGCCHNARMTLDADGRAEIEDDGPGWSLTDASGKPRAERFMTELLACRAAKKDARVGQVACSVGLAVVNALSELCELTILQDGSEWRQTYAGGKPLAPFDRVGGAAGHGTRLSFKLDPAILPRREFALEPLVEWLRQNAGSLTVDVFDRRTGERVRVTPASK